MCGLYRHSSDFKPWRNQVVQIERYWALYGGTETFVKSPYAQISFVIGVIISLGPAEGFSPSGLAISIVPNLLGFTVGALAIILAFSSSEIFTHLTQNGIEKSLFMKTVANFIHFILIQVITILISIIYSSHKIYLLEFLSGVFLIYSILTTLSTGILLFQMSVVFNASKQKPPSKREASNAKEE